MAIGKQSGALGNSVPLTGEAEIRQQSTAADVLTITGASGVGGHLLVVRTYAVPDGSTNANLHALQVDSSGITRINKVPVVDVSSGSTAVSIGASQSGSILMIGGASAAQTITLPALQTGLNYLFYNSDAEVSSAALITGAASGLMMVAGDSGGADAVRWGSTVSVGAAFYIFGSTASGKWHVLPQYNGSSLMGTTGAGVFAVASS